MKAFLFLVLVCFLCFVGVEALHRYAPKGATKVDLNKPFILNRPSTLQARTSHLLFLPTEDGTAVCTGTVIGPHAILTAEHCSPEKIVRFDYAVETYNVLYLMKDDREHIIFLVDGPPFTEIQPYITRAPVVGESTYLYGFGKRVYPATAKLGIVLNEYDPSEVDLREGLFYVSNPVLQGDSGSAVYGQDGYILGVVTYRLTDGLPDLISHGGVFRLAFTPKQVEVAQRFCPGWVKSLSKPRTAPKESKGIHSVTLEP